MNEISSAGRPAYPFPRPAPQHAGRELSRIGIALSRAEIERCEWLDK